MDGTHLQRHAAHLQVLADRARAAAAVAAATEDVEWRSVAASRFREALRHEADLARRCAELLDDAARAMAAHAQAVQSAAHVSAVQAAKGILAIPAQAAGR